jgi:hypothetical protein
VSGNAYVKCELWNCVASIRQALNVFLTCLYLCKTLYLQKFYSCLHFNLNLNGRQRPNCQIFQEIDTNCWGTGNPGVYYSFPAILVEFSPIISKSPTRVVVYCISIVYSQLPIQWARFSWWIFKSTSIDPISSERHAETVLFEKMETFLKNSSFDSVGELRKAAPQESSNEGKSWTNRKALGADFVDARK